MTRHMGIVAVSPDLGLGASRGSDLHRFVRAADASAREILVISSASSHRRRAAPIGWTSRCGKSKSLEILR